MGRHPILVLLLTALPLQAGTYKCLGPDGGVVYQQGPCSGPDRGGELAVDTRAPGGPDGTSSPKDLSVEGQLKALESARARERKAKAAAVRDAQGKDPGPTYDRAKCAKHRAETARWDEKVRGTYRTRAEQTRARHMLEHHQILVERYCAPQ